MLPSVTGFSEKDVFDLLPCEFSKRITLMMIWFLIFAAMFLALYTRPVSKRMAEKCSKNPEKGVRLAKQDLATRMSALVHATIISYGCIAILFLNGESVLYYAKIFDGTADLFETHTDDAVFYACVACGYFVADFILTTILFEEDGFGLPFLIHATVGFSGAFYIIVSNYGAGYLMWVSFTEISTPFLQIRWILLEYGYKDSILSVLNGLCLVSAFTLARIIVGIPVLAHMTYHMQTTQVGKMNVYSRTILSIACVALGCLNLNWGLILWTNFIKTVRKFVGGGGKHAKKEN